MSRRAFLFILPFLSRMAIPTDLPTLGTPVKVRDLPTSTSLPSAVPSTVTPLADRLGRCPTATPLGGGGRAAGSPLPTPNLSTPGKGEKSATDQGGRPLSSIVHRPMSIVASRSQILRCPTWGNVPSRGAHTLQHDEYRRPQADIIHSLEVTL